MFTYDTTVPKPSKKGLSATIVFSGLATADWRWQGGRYVRYVDGSPMKLEDGAPVATDNVVIQQVKTTQSTLHDVLGYPSPEVSMIGTGKAWVLRDGRVITGTWSRPGLGDITVFKTTTGDGIHLAPGHHLRRAGAHRDVQRHHLLQLLGRGPCASGYDLRGRWLARRDTPWSARPGRSG